MRVETIESAYTLYTCHDGSWVMHVWRRNSNKAESWLETVLNVSAKDPFKSSVEYNVWVGGRTRPHRCMRF